MEQAINRPAHLWIVGLLSAAWNAFGATDYVMTETHNAAWLASATAAQRAYFDHFPAWEVACWALGVWGALAGSLLLLAGSRHAVTAFALSLAGLAINTAYQFAVAPPPGGVSGGLIGLNAVIWAVAIALLIYAAKMRAQGVLR